MGRFFKGFWMYINARTHCVQSTCFFVLGEVVGDVAVLLPPLEYDLGVDCTLFVMFFTCSSMLGFRILECFEVIAFMSGVMAKSHGLVCCDWSGLLTCGLVSFVRFGLPGMVSYGLDHLC